MHTICICGAGTMGSGIAQVAAASGFTTILFDVNTTVLEKAEDKLRTDLQKLVEKQKIAAEKKDEILKNIQFTSAIEHCIADVVIEAIIEKPELKIALFNQLSAINPATAIFASNTSSLSITELAQNIINPERFAGLHFFNPAPLMKLVEVVKGEQTSAEVINILVKLSRTFGKIPVVCKDSPGFIVNRVARPYYLESLRLVEQDVAGFETIDRLLEDKGFKMGPFRLMDLIGNDVNYSVSCSVYEQLKNPVRLKPSPIQKEKVENGALGRKTGKGYYTY
ncbi:MAG TPA: 3-hydroxyacyl-CoA dehydrogenase NAD-binding domain-containing protein [Flavisolibacter sp.]|nr:3-hydroxyacyl-CoA dehydrogenase NAD-binding domain-containing protein [Flavisolibacter sp.]